jgi:hypothetical protein
LSICIVFIFKFGSRNPAIQSSGILHTDEMWFEKKIDMLRVARRFDGAASSGGCPLWQ